MRRLSCAGVVCNSVEGLLLYLEGGEYDFLDLPEAPNPCRAHAGSIVLRRVLYACLAPS